MSIILSLKIGIQFVLKKSKQNTIYYQRLLFINKKYYKIKDQIYHKHNLLCQRYLRIRTIPINLKNESRNRFYIRYINIQANSYPNNNFLYHKMYLISRINLYNTDLNIYLRTNIGKTTISQLLVWFLRFGNT